MDKDKSEFRKRASLKRGYQSWCKDCERLANNSRYISKPKKESAKKDTKLFEKKRQLKIRYNLSYEDYLLMYKRQEGKCLICQREKILGTPGGLYVDHCHITGVVRGLLCPRCNTILGFIEANSKDEFLKNLTNYLT